MIFVADYFTAGTGPGEARATASPERVDAGMAAQTYVPDADTGLELVVLCGVGEAGMLLFGIVRHEAEVHPPARSLAIGQTSDARQVEWSE